MENINPAKKKPEPEAAAPALQPSTPDPHEATRPVRVTQSKPADLSESAQSKPLPIVELEDTKPVHVRPAPAEPTPTPAAPTGEELPAWLISFAAQETQAVAPIDPEEYTRQIPVGQPEPPAEVEQPLAPALVPTEQASGEGSGWTVESLLEEAAAESKAEELESQPTAEAAPAAEPALELAATVAATPEQSIQEGEDIAAENTPVLALEKALDAGSYAEAALMLKEMAADPAARTEALGVLRPRLHMRAESQPLWQFYADLCSADDQPGLAQQALETAEKLKDEAGEEHGTIAGIG